METTLKSEILDEASSNKDKDRRVNSDDLFVDGRILVHEEIAQRKVVPLWEAGLESSPITNN